MKSDLNTYVISTVVFRQSWFLYKWVKLNWFRFPIQSTFLGALCHHCRSLGLGHYLLVYLFSLELLDPINHKIILLDYHASF